MAAQWRVESQFDKTFFFWSRLNGKKKRKKEEKKEEKKKFRRKIREKKKKKKKFVSAAIKIFRNFFFNYYKILRLRSQ